MIRVVEIFGMGNRDRCSKIQSLLDSPIDTWEPTEFLTQLNRAQLFTSPVYSEKELRLAKQANAKLGAARKAYRAGNFDGVQRALSEALTQARAIVYSLNHVSDVIAKAKARVHDLNQAKVTPARQTTIGGKKALTFNYSFYEDWRKTTFHGREAFVVANNRLFSVTYIGIGKYLSTYDDVVATVSFPEGDCAH